MNPSKDYLEDYSVQHVVAALKETLISYLEMQYHVKNNGLIKERRCLLDQEETVFQRPFIESTPVYEQGRPSAQIDIPSKYLFHLMPVTITERGNIFFR